MARATAGGALSRAREHAVVVVGVLAFACVELFYPFGRDQGNYAYPAWVWLEGQMPYRDVYVFKPPGTVWVHALAQLLFGHSLVAVRVLDLGWTVGTALVIAAVVRRWLADVEGGGPAAPIAGVAYAFFYLDFDFWNTCQTDGWANLPGALALLLATRVRSAASSDRVLPAAGGLVAFAMCLKYTAGAFAVPVVAVLAAAAVTRGTWRRFGMQLALLAGGGAVVAGATALWLWVNGAMPGFLDAQTVLVPAYVEKTGKTTGVFDKLGLLYAKYTTLDELFLPSLALGAGLVAVAAKGRRHPVLGFALLWLLGGLVSTMAQDKYFRYHFLTTLPGTAVLGAIAAAAAFEALSKRSRPAAYAVAAASVLALLGASNFPDRWATSARILAGTTTLRATWERPSFKLDGAPLVQVYDCADRVEAITEPGDRVFVWGYDPLINYVSERFTVSRFLYNYPFAVSWGDPTYEAELMAALEATPPELFVVASGDANKAVTGNPKDSAELLAEFDALRRFLGERYDHVETVHRYAIHRRR